MGHGGRVNDGNGGERVGHGEEESGARERGEVGVARVRPWCCGVLIRRGKAVDA